jgi:uncharacterized membrane protein YcaP (DUF421 family)
LVHEGEFLDEHLRRVGLTEEDVLGAIRKHGYDDLAAIHLAVLETNGDVGVVPRKQGKRSGGAAGAKAGPEGGEPPGLMRL